MDAQMMREFSHFYHVEGWLNISALRFVEYFSDIFLQGAVFDALEIGVHHGKLFIGIENLTPQGCRCLAIDVFSEQEKNIDRSGKGDLDIFRENVAKYCVDPSRVTELAMDSLDIDVQAIGRNRFGIVSIDGGHTERHTFSDLRTAADLMMPSGIVVLDDILNQDWTGVVSGACAYFASPAAGRLVPFALGFNKLYCCHFSVVAKVQKRVMDDREALAAIGIRPFKLTEFAGHRVISLTNQ
jgi:hypothetical protein